MGSARRFFVSADIGGPEDFHLGDEAMLEANLQAMRRRYAEVEFVATSRDPTWTEARYGLRAIRAPSMGSVLPGPLWDDDSAVRERTSWLLPPEVVEAVRAADGLIVSGGGNLCSTWPDKILERAALIHCARDSGRPAVVLGQTLGPDLYPRESTLLGAALRRADFVGVRDRPSADLARRLGVSAERVHLQFDDTFLLEPRAVEDERARPLREAERRFILVSLDASLGAVGNERFLESLAGQLEALATAIDGHIVFVSHVRGSAVPEGFSDEAVGRRLTELIQAPVWIPEIWRPDEVRWLTARAALVVSTRYHGIVFANAAGTPAIGIYSDRYTRVKLQGALEHMGLVRWSLSLELAARGELLLMAMELWSDRDAVRRALARRIESAIAGEALRWQHVGDALGLSSAGVSVPERPAFDRTSPRIESSDEERRSPAGSIGDEDWRQYTRDGYLRLGRIVNDDELAALQERVDSIMLGHVRLRSLQTQLDTGGAYDELPDPVSGLQASAPTLAYRKVQGLEGDPLFLSLLRHDRFREICRWHYGPHAPVSIFRAMVMNKPARRGTHLPWHQDGGDVWKLDRDPLVTTWVALDTAARENGCLQVIPGSHRLGLLSKQGSTISAEHAERYCPEAAIAHLEVEAGEALLLHNWLLHRSGVNETASPRRAFTACYMDGRTLHTLTGDRSPILFGEHEDADAPLPFLRALREELRVWHVIADDRERYAKALLAHNDQRELHIRALEAEVEELKASRAARPRRGLRFAARWLRI
jgi:polysaccharide pyruvyl transferase WcaK-like protein